MSKGGARGKLRAHFEANLGRVMTSDELREVAGISEWARRVRELRDIEGMQILTFRDRADLKPNEYLLESTKRLPAIDRDVSNRLRTEILERNGFTCQLCGSAANDADPGDSSKKLRLVIDHIVPIAQGGTNERGNLRVLCTACNAGRSNLHTPSESARDLLARVRKAKRDVQLEVYESLKRTFGGS